jgi:sugar O-acyltransferase (sialic acid O-acetyltransferase NeuD family)
MVMGFPVLSEAQIFSSTNNKKQAFVIAVGDNWQRYRLVDRISSRFGEAAFPKTIHPGAHVSRFAQLDDGCVVLAGCVVNQSASVGRHSVLWSNSVVEHDCHLGEFTTLSPGAVLGGCVSLGSRTFLGVGACVRPDVAIGRDTVIAAGAAVVSNVEDEAILAGVPARLLRHRSPEEPYL